MIINDEIVVTGDGGSTGGAGAKKASGRGRSGGRTKKAAKKAGGRAATRGKPTVGKATIGRGGYGRQHAVTLNGKKIGTISVTSRPQSLGGGTAISVGGGRGKRFKSKPEAARFLADRARGKK